MSGALASMSGSSGADLAQALLEKFPAAGGYAIGVFLDEQALGQLNDPANVLNQHASILVMRNYAGDMSKLHYLHVLGTSYDLLEYVDATGSAQINLIVANSQSEQQPTSMSVKEITSWTSANPAYVSTQGYAFGTTMKTVTRAAEVAGIVTGGTATAAIRAINSLPFDVGVYDAAHFESSGSTVQSYHVPLVRFLDGENRELPELIQPTYTLLAHDVQVTGFLVPLSSGSSPSLPSLADAWTGQQGALQRLSDTPGSSLAGFAGNDVLGNLGKGTSTYHQAQAVFVIVDVTLAPPVGNYRLKDVTDGTFTQPLTHTQIQGFAAPSQPHSVLLDFTLANGQPKLYQLPVIAAGAAGPVTIDGVFIKTPAQDTSVATKGSAITSGNAWATAVAEAGSTLSNVLVTTNGIFYAYKVTPAGLGGPLPMLLTLSGGDLTWTPTIASNFARYEVRQSDFLPTSPTDGTLLTTIHNSQTTTYTLPSGTTGYFVVWAFNDQGHAPSTPVYVEPAPTVALSSVAYCSSNIRQCLHVTWTQYSGSGFEKYELHRRISGSGSWSVAQTVTSSSTTAISDNGLTCGTSYDYKVIVYASGKSGESNVLTGNPNNGYGFCDQPSTTLNYVVYCTTNQKTCLSSGWTAYDGQGFEKYELQRRVGTSGAWEVAATITNAATTEYSDNGLICGTTYNYRVVLYVAGGSAESNVMAGNPNNGFGGCY